MCLVCESLSPSCSVLLIKLPSECDTDIQSKRKKLSTDAIEPDSELGLTRDYHRSVVRESGTVHDRQLSTSLSEIDRSHSNRLLSFNTFEHQKASFSSDTGGHQYQEPKEFRADYSYQRYELLSVDVDVYHSRLRSRSRKLIKPFAIPSS